MRYPCTPEAYCQLPAAPPANACLAQTRNISNHGLGSEKWDWCTAENFYDQDGLRDAVALACCCALVG